MQEPHCLTGQRGGISGGPHRRGKVWRYGREEGRVSERRRADGSMGKGPMRRVPGLVETTVTLSTTTHTIIGRRETADGRSKVGTSSSGRGGSDISMDGNDSRGWCSRIRGGMQRRNRGNRKVAGHSFDLRVY